MPRRRPGALLALLVLAATPAAALGAPTITEYTSGLTTKMGPAGIAAGPDGALWFTESANPGAIGRIGTAGAITEHTSLQKDSQPLAIVAGPDGRLWFTEAAAGGAVGALSTGGSLSEYSGGGLSSNAQPTGVAAGPDGALWFTERANPGRIGRITTSGSVTEFTTGLSSNAQPNGIAAGPDGNLWFTEVANPGRIGRITTSGSVTEFTTGLSSNAQPTSIAAGPDGNLWFTEVANPGRIGRITPAGVISEFTAGLTANSQPTGIAAGPDGNLWFTEVANPGRIGRITPAGVITEFTAGLTANSQPTGIAAGPDGAMWFTEKADPGRIGRITVGPGLGAAGAGGTDDRSTTVSAGVTPNGQATGVVVEWGTTGAYGQTTSSTSAGSGTSEQVVGIPLTGLAPSTTYHYRVVATNASGTATGADQTFTTTAPPPPAVGSPGATDVDAHAATLSATVDPNRLATAYSFEYGPTAAYGWQTPSASAGSGSGPQPVSAPVAGLSPATTYHFRVVATNASGTTQGADQTFTTAPPEPLVSAVTATAVDDRSATLGATVDPNLLATTYRFEYGTTAAYGSVTATASAGSGGPQQVSAPVGGLAPRTTYHVRVVATNASGTTEGADGTFTTSAAPLPVAEPAPVMPAPVEPLLPVTPSPAPMTPLQPPAPPPVLGRAVTAGVTAGTVLVRIRGAAAPVPLDGAASIPVGSLVDASRGTVTIQAALPDGTTQTGAFWGGAFVVRQSARGAGVTDIALRRLVGCRTARPRGAHSMARRKPPSASLWGHDSHGRFSTHGANSVATVRGTTWLSVERCDGTLTRVTEGRVLVRDLGRRRTVLLRPGTAYLARARHLR
jgi:virginiamycin B lyase